jgi:hypothetical protein
VAYPLTMLFTMLSVGSGEPISDGRKTQGPGSENAAAVIHERQGRIKPESKGEGLTVRQAAPPVRPQTQAESFPLALTL